LTESRKDLKEDPQERLLTELVNTFRNISEPSPREEFRPTRSSLVVNTLWFTSLTLTLMSALAGVLAKGWLAKYNPVSRRDRSKDAYERQLRFNVAEAWGLSTVIQSIPFLIQVSLFFFFAGLLVQIEGDHLTIRLVLLILVLLAASLYVFWTASPLFIAEFPFPTPLTRYLQAISWPRKGEPKGNDPSESPESGWNSLLEALESIKKGLADMVDSTKAIILRACHRYDPMELQLQILTWGANTADEETVDESIKALSGAKKSTELRNKLYGQELHQSLFLRLQQQLQPTTRSSLALTNASQIQTILLSLLKIEDPFHLDDNKNPKDLVLPSWLEQVTPPNWEEFKPHLQPLAFSLRIHMLVNRNEDDHRETWLQRVVALDRMAQNPSTLYVRKILLFAVLRGLLRGRENTRQECGIVLARLLTIRKFVPFTRPDY
jgi:hypothetical protein